MNERPDTCGWCGELLDGRSDKQYCNASHRRQARRKRKKLREQSNYLSQRSQSSLLQADAREADARFHAMLAAEEAARVPDAHAAEWKTYARRHGSIHPDEQAARLARGREARLADWGQGTQVFVRPGGTLAEKARASRAQQVRDALVRQDPGRWDNLDDPELLEPAEMVQGNIFRSGHRHAAGYR